MFHVLNFPNVLFAWIVTLCFHDKNKAGIDFIGMGSLSFILNDHNFHFDTFDIFDLDSGILKIYCLLGILKLYTEEVIFKNLVIDLLLYKFRNLWK